jgi:MYXO-CTERM domain-containing protein
MIFGLNPNSTETAAEFEGVAMAEAGPAAESTSPAAEGKSSGGNSKALEIGISLGVIIFALLVAAALAAFFVHRRRRGIRIPELDHYAAEHKDYNQADIKPLAPKENYELETIQAKENNHVALRHENNHVALRHELASLPAELA